MVVEPRGVQLTGEIDLLLFLLFVIVVAVGRHDCGCDGGGGG